MSRNFAFKQADLTTVKEPEVKVEEPYDHGYTEEQVKFITEQHALLKQRDLKLEPITMEEFKKVVVPFLRINRVSAFNLKAANTKKPKEPRAPKVPKEPKAPKAKKLTKKFIETELSRIIMARAMGVEVSQDDLDFFNTHTKSDLL